MTKSLFQKINKKFFWGSRRWEPPRWGHFVSAMSAEKNTHLFSTCPPLSIYLYKYCATIEGHAQNMPSTFTKYKQREAAMFSYKLYIYIYILIHIYIYIYILVTYSFLFFFILPPFPLYLLQATQPYSWWVHSCRNRRVELVNLRSLRRNSWWHARFVLEQFCCHAYCCSHRAVVERERNTCWNTCSRFLSLQSLTLLGHVFTDIDIFKGLNNCIKYEERARITPHHKKK